MLTLTEEGMKAIRTLTSRPGLTGESGLRIVSQDGAGALALSVSAAPEPGDEIIEAGDVRVFLQPDAAAMLKGATLTARIEEDGETIFQIKEWQTT